MGSNCRVFEEGEDLLHELSHSHRMPLLHYQNNSVYTLSDIVSTDTRGTFELDCEATWQDAGNLFARSLL